MEVAVAVSESGSDGVCTGWSNLTSNSNETEFSSDDGVVMGVSRRNAVRYLDDLNLLPGREDIYINEEEVEDQNLPQDDRGLGFDFNGAERGGGTRDAVSEDDTLAAHVQDDGELELVGDVLRDGYEQENRIHIEQDNDLSDVFGANSGALDK